MATPKMGKKVVQTTLQTPTKLPSKYLPIRTILEAPSNALLPQHERQLAMWKNKLRNTSGARLFNKAISRLKRKLPEWQIDVEGGALQPQRKSNLKLSIKTTAKHLPGEVPQEMRDRIDALDNSILNEMFEQGGEDLFKSVYVYEQAYDERGAKLSTANYENMENFLQAYDDYVASRKLWLSGK